MTSTTGHPGWFVVFEGGDGVGKSTHVQLAAQALSKAGVDHLVTREPGGSRLGERIRELLLDPATGFVAPRAEALMYAADKAQHLHDVVLPALRRGAVVICDRYLDSMIAYQGAGRVLDVDDIRGLGQWATEGLRPDLTVLLDVDPREALADKQAKDRLEAEDSAFHARVRQGFLDLAAEDPQSYLVLAGRRPKEETAADIRAALGRLGVPGLGCGPADVSHQAGSIAPGAGGSES
ncbi:dTMP kinase [Propionibacterium cyclohexanicum]|uniref:Thymidylate kinase n=1 Tax=Propionibacterium cyclohexanicum TaxID=64702 RepID=A0A1H9RX72_9ACTN|nr:dTMP kinase [Propionibacterium cyclohexanicum]SER76733.1 dTMP kinase [Propionibacterium cyclohexanicum]